MQPISKRIAGELGIREKQVTETLKLLDEGNTIPFIARYRKEMTGSLDDQMLRKLEERLIFHRSLDEKKEDVLRKINEMERLTPELEEKIQQAESVSAVDDLYLPFRPKRRTRAGDAREKGLEGAANLLYANRLTSEEDLSPFLSDAVPTVSDALAGALDIVAEDISENATVRDIVRRMLWNGAIVQSTMIEEDAKYDMYRDFSEKVSEIPAHRILAVNRGEKEGFLRVKLEIDEERVLFRILRETVRFLPMKIGDFCYMKLEEAVKDSYRRLIFPSLSTEIRNTLTEKADRESIDIFAGNLRAYLMQPPLKETVVMGIDPGFRTGCKVAVIDAQGTFLDQATVYPTAPREDVLGTKKTLTAMIKKYGVTLIAIGNGTASRETEQVVAEMLSEEDLDAYYAIVNESGASIYSAGELAAKEFPDLDVTIRGAVSIARRIQDPLAELVKIEAKHIGVGQYQHDVNQKMLKGSLDQVVERCVNEVGVNVNTASSALLRFVSGITKSLADNIVMHKEENGPFASREALKEVKGMGPKSFLLAAGFLRIPGGSEMLDNTAVHPESYSIAKILLEQGDDAEIPGVGGPTLDDIRAELKRPGRDPRETFPKPVFRRDVLSLDDLSEGMELTGTVRNVVAFGAFVDIGIKQDGLIHISRFGDGFHSDPAKILQVSDSVHVKVVSIDRQRQRIGLSMKGVKQDPIIEERRKNTKRKRRK